MKCDTCINKKFHVGGGFFQVAEGGDDPYDYFYCRVGYWDDDPENYEKFNEDVKNNEKVDPWIDCKDYICNEKNILNIDKYDYLKQKIKKNGQ